MSPSGRAALLAALIVLTPSAGALGLLGPRAYIVGYEPGGLDEVLDLARVLGFRVDRTLDAVDAVVLTAPALADVVGLLSRLAVVSYVEPDVPTRAAGAQWNGAQWDGAQWDQWDAEGDPGRDEQWGLATVGASDAWATAGGSRSARLCVVDSGVDWDHPDLAGNAWSADGERGFNAITGTGDATDDAGHGTHVAGIAAAVHDNGVGVSGVSNSLIMSAKVLGADGKGKVGDLVLGMTWCADHGADVALLALSVDGESKTVERAISYLDARDVIIVASAGNGGATSGVSYPARDPRVVAVAAIDRSGALASFSSRGPEVDLAAPGVGIVSTFDGATYASGSGTSQAAAFVAGAAVLLREADGSISAPDARRALVDGARPVGGLRVLDVGGALEEA